MTLTYIKQLEEQNEELKQKLAKAESAANDASMAHHVLATVLRNSGYDVQRDANRTIVNISMSEVVITTEDIGEQRINALAKLLEILHSKKKQFDLAEMGHIYKNLFIASCESKASLDYFMKATGYVK
jgi:hypothetical protein